MPVANVETEYYAAAGEIESLVRGFEKCTLPWSSWTHAAHLTVALWYLLHHEWAEAVRLMREGIKSYNAASGVATTRERGYHETLTIFWMRYVCAFLETNYNEGRATLKLANSLIAHADKNAPLEFYSRELLFSWEARIDCVEPDLKPLPTTENRKRLAREHVDA